MYCFGHVYNILITYAVEYNSMRGITYRSIDRQCDGQSGESSRGHSDHAVPNLYACLQRSLYLAALLLFSQPFRLRLPTFALF